MRFPTPRGPLSDCLFSALSGKGRHALSSDACVVGAPTADPIVDEDLQLSLWACYQLHYGGFDDVDDRWEWDPAVLTFRAALEDRFERFLRHQAAQQPVLAAKDVPEALADLIATQDGASLSKFVERDATVGQFRELLMHRSLEPLHDPHTFAIPRLAGRPQAALIEIQIGELGSGHTADMRMGRVDTTVDDRDADPAPRPQRCRRHRGGPFRRHAARERAPRNGCPESPVPPGVPAPPAARRPAPARGRRGWPRRIGA